MKIRRPWMIRLVALLGAWLIRWWNQTLRFRKACEGGIPHLVKSDTSYIYLFWHETLLPLVATHYHVHVLISDHADGELIARLGHHLGLKTVRGSTGKRGERALFEMRRRLKEGHIGIATDGPQGPRQQVQPGVLLLASITGAPVVPIGVGFSSAWRAKSWDRFAIPKLRSIVTIRYGKPVHIPKKVRGAQRRQYLQILQDEMDRVTEEAQRWADSGAEEPPSTGEELLVRRGPQWHCYTNDETMLERA